MNPLTLLFIMAFLVSVDLRILAPVLPSISLSLKSSPGTIGFAMTTYSLAYGIGQLFYGPLSDRLGRIEVVRSAGVGFIICTILSALSVTPWQFIVARLLAGTFAGAVIPLTLVYIGDTVEYSRRQSVIGLYSVVTSAAMAFSAAIGGTVAHFISWRMMLLGYGSFALIPIFCMWRIKFHKTSTAAVGAERIADLMKNRSALSVYAAVFLEGFFLWGCMTYFGSFAAHRYRIDQFTIGLLIALMGVGTMLGGILMNRSKVRISENAMSVVGGMLMGASFLILIPNWSAPAFGVSAFILGLGFVGLHTTLQLRGTEISSAARGKAFSFFVCSLFLGIATGSAAFGWFANNGRYEVMFAIAGLGLIGIGLVMGNAMQSILTRISLVIALLTLLGTASFAAETSSIKETRRDGSFIAYENGPVLDRKTNLVWAPKDNGFNIDWQNAKSYCENYRGGGYVDWRMPTLEELNGLHDMAKAYKSDLGYIVNLTELIRLTSHMAWASDTRGADAACFNFDSGKRFWVPQSFDFDYRVLPVRPAR